MIIIFFNFNNHQSIHSDSLKSYMDVLQCSLSLSLSVSVCLSISLSRPLSLSLSVNNCLLPSCHQTTLSHFTASLILQCPCQELTFNFHTSPSCYSFFFLFGMLALRTAGGGADTTRARNSNLSLWQGYLTCDVQCHLCTTQMLNGGFHSSTSLSFSSSLYTALNDDTRAHQKTLGGRLYVNVPSKTCMALFSPVDTPCYHLAASTSWWTQVGFSELEKQKESAAEAETRKCKANSEVCKELVRFWPRHGERTAFGSHC